VRRPLVLICAALAAGACGSAPDAKVVAGGEQVGVARDIMRRGLVFAPYFDPLVGADSVRGGVPAQQGCIDAVNQVVNDRLVRKFPVVPGYAAKSRGTDLPHWAKALAGPRVAVHVESFRCGPVTGDPKFTASKLALEPGEKEDDGIGEVVLTVHDRNTGQVVVRIRGSADGSTGVAAARAAAAAAAEVLTGPLE
jgi:hypothetical protein